MGRGPEVAEEAFEASSQPRLDPEEGAVSVAGRREEHAGWGSAEAESPGRACP